MTAASFGVPGPSVFHAFTCPRCGSHHFRTVWVPDASGKPTWPGEHLGECKGRHLGGGEYAGCSFRWRRADDAAVFVDTRTKEGQDHA